MKLTAVLTLPGPNFNYEVSEQKLTIHSEVNGHSHFAFSLFHRNLLFSIKKGIRYFFDYPGLLGKGKTLVPKRRYWSRGPCRLGHLRCAPVLPAGSCLPRNFGAFPNCLGLRFYASRSSFWSVPGSLGLLAFSGVWVP